MVAHSSVQRWLIIVSAGRRERRLLLFRRSISRCRIGLWQIECEVSQRRLRRIFHRLRTSSLSVYLSESLIRLSSIGRLFL